MLYESISNSLNRNMNRMLNEKKQQISPEDERDNELLRSALDKLSLGDDLTEEEMDAIERNGFQVSNDTLRPAYGYVDSRTVYNPYHQPGYSNANRRVTPRRTFITNDEIPANVNLADLGRKRKERMEVFGGELNSELFKPSFSRNAKKAYNDYDGSRNQNIRNIENILRNNENNILHTNYRRMSSLLGKRDDAKEEVEKAYERETTERETLLQRIAQLKAELKNLESRREDRIKDSTDKIDRINDLVRKELDRKKEKINAKRNKSESLRRRAGRHI